MFCFLETDIREQKCEKRIQTTMDNTVNDLNYQYILLFFLKQKYILFLEIYIFKIPKSLIASALFFVFLFFFAEPDTKKHRYASAKASNAALVKLTD